MRVALDAEDGKTLGSTAHQLIGSLGAIGATAASALARELEKAAIEGNFTSASGGLSDLENDLYPFLARLERDAETLSNAAA
jgi:HPt (histidine-containing phosphotransfer) domain-containing protein